MARKRPMSHSVDRLGDTMGVTYQEGEPLRAGRKELERDEHRWELDPASSEDYGPRAHEESARRPKRKRAHG